MGTVLAVEDRTRQGALRFLDDEGNPLADDVPPTPRVLDLSRLQSLCQNIESGIGDLGALARELRGATASLGGARPKSVVVDQSGMLHVAKFTMLGDTMPVECVEVATRSLARDVGIRAAKATLAMREGALPVALVERFDREPGEYGRRHYMSARTLLEARRGESRFYTDIGDGLRAVCRTDMEALAEMAELHLRILFTTLVSNNDDHLKNHGLLYAGEGSWALAPAFDINPQPFRHRELKTGISEVSGFDASVEAWIEAAPFFERTEDDARRHGRLHGRGGFLALARLPVGERVDRGPMQRVRPGLRARRDSRCVGHGVAIRGGGGPYSRQEDAIEFGVVAVIPLHGGFARS